MSTPTTTTAPVTTGVTPPPPAAAPTTGGTPPPATWTDSFSDELKGYVQNKGFKEPKDAIESYRNVEKLLGHPKERLLPLPESLEGDDMNPIWERLGTPKEAKEYNIEIPKEYGDEKLADWAKETFHKNKVPRAMAENFVKAWNERQAAEFKTMAENAANQVKQEHEALKKEWGAAYEQNENIAQVAATKFGISKEDLASLGSVMGPSRAMKLLHQIGQGLGEGKFVEGGSGGNKHMTPAQAKTDIAALIKDTDFARRLQSGDVDARKKWDNLHAYASQGEITI